MKFDISTEIPELALLIDYSERIEKIKQILNKLQEVQWDVAIKTIESLSRLEKEQEVWFGEDLLVDFQGKQFLVKGLTDNESDPITVSLIQHTLSIEDKQTRGPEREKESS